MAGSSRVASLMGVDFVSSWNARAQPAASVWVTSVGGGPPALSDEDVDPANGLDRAAPATVAAASGRRHPPRTVDIRHRSAPAGPSRLPPGDRPRATRGRADSLPQREPGAGPAQARRGLTHERPTSGDPRIHDPSPCHIGPSLARRSRMVPSDASTGTISPSRVRVAPAMLVAWWPPLPPSAELPAPLPCCSSTG